MKKFKKIYNQNEYFIVTDLVPKYTKGWLKIQAMAEKKGLLKKGKIGNADSMFFNVKEIVSIYENELKHNINKLFNI